MKKLSLLGVLCIGVIALVSTSTNANDPLASGLLNTFFIISCGVIGVFMLHKANLTLPLIVRQKGSRRLGLPAKFPLTDCQDEFVNQDRRRLPDRRLGKYGHDALKRDTHAI